jgi:nucleotide-binding universal stress UspA family protein
MDPTSGQAATETPTLKVLEASKRRRLGMFEPMNTIVTGYDGSTCADRALGRAADLSQALGTELIVVSVGRPEPLVAGPEVMVASGMPVAASPGALATRPAAAPPIDETAVLLEQARRALGSRSVEADFVGERGDPSDRLLAVAKARNADLIVVGCHQHSLLHRFLGHPVDEELARRAHCDVLLVH